MLELDVDRPELQRHVQDRQDHGRAQRRVLAGFGPHRGPDRAGRDASHLVLGRGRQRLELHQHRLRRLGGEFDHHGHGPLHGTYQPTGQLSTLDGHTVDIQNSGSGQWVPGVWTLQLTNSATGATGMLDNWSLNITPVITVTPVNPVNGTATTFTIGFPLQQLSGTYTIQLGPNILDTFGDGQLDTNQNAGLAVLRDQESEQPDDHRPVHRGRPAQGDPGADRYAIEPGELHHHRARQFRDPGRHDGRGGQRHAGPDQPDLSQRPRPDGDTAPITTRTATCWAR